MNLKKKEPSLVNESKGREENKNLINSIREKVVISCILIFLIRLGNFIEIPGIDKTIFLTLIESNSFSNTRININGSISFPSLFYLGIGPSINASIIIQLFIAVNPELKRYQKEEGEFGRKKIDRYIRYLTLFLAILQSFFFIFSIKSSIYNWNIERGIEITCFLTTGAMIVLWISERITKDGIANGSSLLVFLNIISIIPKQFQELLPYLNFYKIIILSVTLLITTCSVVILQKSIQCVPIISLKLLSQNKEASLINQRTFFPVKLNQAGVMPIVFTSYLLPIIKLFSYFILLKINNAFNFKIVFPEILNQFLYSITEFFLICFFTNFYSLLIMDPKDVSENLQKASFFISGIRPGKPTRNFLNNLFQRQSLLGGIILASSNILLNFIALLINVPILQGIGIGSQIIIVGVILEIIQKIRSLIIVEIYKKSIKIKK